MDSRGPGERGVASARVRSRPTLVRVTASSRVSQRGVTRGRSVALRCLFGRLHRVRTRLGDIPTERRREPVPVVGVDLSVVATTREGNIRQALVHEPLTRLLAVDVQQDPIRRQPLTAVARNGVAMIEVAVRLSTVRRRVNVERDALACIGANAHLLPVRHRGDRPHLTVCNLGGGVWRVNVTGIHHLDTAIVLSISGLQVGDKVMIPGSDIFAKSIQNLWRQKLFSNVQIYITKVQDDRIWIEINVAERPRLGNFKFVGIKKSEAEELQGKMGLAKQTIITENMRRNIKEVTEKYYRDKGFQNVTVTIRRKT